ncbi:DegT/DnrJ/EryC1/StrS family aminotransferase [Methylophilaceae bacterium]|nr:DegT/DnrJ/EryC1/StrS family aminotransferase [Methylophilaceae bacterium]
MNIPFLDLKKNHKKYAQEVNKAVLAVVNSGQYILGKKVIQFEENFAAYSNVKYCVGVANGLDALQLSLKVLNIIPGDEVIVPANTYIATWLAVTNVGAIPVPVEPSVFDYNIDPKKIEQVITKKTKAIIVVHLYGQPADLSPILKLVKKYKLKIVEDAAQAHGASYKNRSIGSHGDLVAWSFYPGKNLGAYGDAGAVTTNNKNYYEMIKALRNYGSKEKYINYKIGFNSRLDPIQAAVLDIKLKYLSEMNSKRKAIAKQYLENINEYPSLFLPLQRENSDHVWHLFVIRHNKRNKLQEFLIEKGISTLIHYPIPPHLQKAFQFLNLKKGCLPISEKLHKQVLSLPIDPLMSKKSISYVIKHVNMAIKYL